MARTYPEDNLQMAAALYLDHLPGVVWCHVANERKAKITTGARLKKKGVKPGVPDILIFNEKKGLNGLAIELKIGKKEPTESQKDWLKKLDNQNWKTAVCYSIDQVIEVVSDYFSD